MKKMIQKQYSSGFSFPALLACSFFLGILVITTSPTSITASRPRGIAAISLTSPSSSSQSEYYASSANEHQQQNGKANEGVKCKTEQGQDVDWFIAYKLPKIRTSSNALVRAGLAYTYILPAIQTFSSSSETATLTVEQRANVIAASISSATNNASGRKGPFFGGHENSSKNNGNETSVRATENPAENEDGMFGSGSAWTLSAKGIDSPESIVGQTLGNLYVKDNQKVAFLTYNDQPPVGPTIDSGAHSKGVILSSLASGGIWLQHSVPHFPLIDANNYHYQYPGTGKSNGQVFHCISFAATKDVDDLAKIFEITKPHVANYSFPTEAFKQAMSQLFSLTTHHHISNLLDEEVNESHNLSIANTNSNQLWRDRNKDGQTRAEEVTQLPCENEIDDKACNPVQAQPSEQKSNWDLVELQSAGGKRLTAFVKGPSFHEDIYSSWIAPTYKTQLDVQSWLNGPHPFPSNCSVSQYSVYNIQDKNIAGQPFSTHNDHSKWAMSLSKEQPLVCISDLNRMEHQLQRGGVTICFTDMSVWTTFKNTIIDVQPCPRLTAFVTSTAGVFGNGSFDHTAYEKEGFNHSATTRKSQHQRQHRHYESRRKVKSRTYSFKAISKHSPL